MPSFVPTALKHPAHRPDHLEDRLLEEELLAARSGALDVDGRVDPLLGELPVEDELRVAGALELLVDHVVHPGAGVDEAGRDDRQRAALLDVPRGAEEPLGRVQGDRVDAARQRPAARRQRQVVRPREAGDRVEQDHDVAAGLDLALGDLERHLGDVGVVLGRLVERGADHLALDAPTHVGDFLGPLADQRDHEEDVRVVLADAVGDVLEQHRLAGLRRAHDQGTLALADRVDDVDESLAEVLRVALEVDQLVRVDRGQVVEDGPVTGGFDVDAVDGIDAEHPPVLLGFARRANGAADPIADPEAEAADLAGADVDVVWARQEAMAAEEAEALVDDVEDAGRVGVAGALRLALEDALDEVVLALLGAGLELEIAADRRGAP